MAQSLDGFLNILTGDTVWKIPIYLLPEGSVPEGKHCQGLTIYQRLWLWIYSDDYGNGIRFFLKEQEIQYCTYKNKKI